MLEIYRFVAFTTPCEVQLFVKDKSIADNCAKDILQEVKRLELKYNYYDSNSYLSQINSRDENRLDLETKNLLTQAKNYYKKTNGIFDITIATIKDIYTKNNTLSEIEKQKSELSKYIGCENFTTKKDKIYFDNEFTKLDLGGFVKEYSVDRVVKIIKKYGIKSALVNFGGDIYALGKKPDGTKFKIAITNPIEKTKTLFGVEIENQALTTSASYERNVEVEDRVFSHILSKNDLESKILSVTVVSNSCLNSGVHSTAIMSDNSLQTKEIKYMIDNNLEVLR
jgi:thiamine biosynthesis lipoprotein